MDKVLTKSDLKGVQEALYRCAQAREQIDAAKSCGLDCQEDEQRCQHLTSYLTGILSTYKPKPGSR